MKAVDLFGGFGGLTAGALMAGVKVVLAANHWKLAVDTHALNHPGIAHRLQDLRLMNWSEVPPGIDLLLGAPACQGYSEASQPKRREYHDALRSTAWVIVDGVEALRPRAFVVENVPAFARWELFDLWRAALSRLGYAVTARTALASHYGVPQRRERLFVIGMRNAARVELPRKQNEPSFGPCVQWDALGWRPLSAATPNARSRMETAKRAHGPRCLSQHTTGHPGVRLDEPIRTITTKDQWVIVDGDRYRPLNSTELRRGMGFADTYRVPAGVTRAEEHRGFGNAVPPPLAHAVVRAVAEAA